MKFLNIIIILLFLTNFESKSDDNIKIIEIDLAKIDEDIIYDISPEVNQANYFQIKLINALPSMKYNIRTGEKVERLGAFKLNINVDAKGCEELFEAEKFNLFYEIDEKIIRLIKQKFKENLNEYCESEQLRKDFLDSITYFTERNVFTSGIDWKKGDIIDIRIVREPSKDDEKEHIWNVALKPNGEKEAKISEATVESPVNSNSGHNHVNEIYSNDFWSFSYGFAFPIMFSDDDYFYVKQNDSLLDKFEIKKRSDNQYIRFIPSLFMHWNPDLGDGIEWSYSVTGGVGFNLESPIVFAGGSVIYHSKLNFNFGLVVHTVNRLNGKYSTGDLVNDILDFWQLHEEHYRMNPFMGVSFKF